MPILNYTTKVSAEQSIAELQKILTKHGARKLLIENDEDGSVSSMSFMIQTERGLVGYRLPLEVDRVLAVLKEQKVEPRFKTKEQAMRVGWRILKDWTEAQLAIIQTRMVTIDQVFLPYAVTKDGKSFYQAAMASGLLESPSHP